MPLKIQKVLQDSCAHKNGIIPGDRIVSINGNEINDFIDLEFYTVEDNLFIEVLDRSGIIRKVELTDCWEGKIGVEPESHRIKKCNNNCIFCFIDQMPPQLRETLYLKDDDYLYSFIFGNYITLNNISDKELERIIRQKISPLYISVHSTDSLLRAKIMGYKKPFNFLDRLKYLATNGISYHTQIVIMPTINDGDYLDQTIEDLTSPALNTLSVGIVPVGLTRFRHDLRKLKPYTPDLAKKVIRQVSPFTERKNPVYLADEFFILAGTEVPVESYYDDFCQLENGIGMVRATISNFHAHKQQFIRQLESKTSLFITAELAENLIKGFSNELNNYLGAEKFTVLKVDNRFFGESVTVSGLLSFRDIQREVDSLDSLPDTIILSNNTFNNDGYTVDNYHFNQLKKIFGRDILIVNELWNGWFYA